jgi:tetratricopeptide (TPR) repeat protein
MEVKDSMTDPTTYPEYVQQILITVTEEGHPDFEDVRQVHGAIIEDLMRGEFRRAEHACLMALETDSQDSLLWTLYALAIWNTRDGDGVRDSVQKAHDLSNKYSLTWNLMGGFLNRLGQVFEAVFAYETSLLIDGNQVLPRKHLSAIYKMRSNWEKSLEHVKELVHLVPDEIGAWGNLDETLEHLGDPESGQELVRELTTQHPTNHLAWWLYGTVMARCSNMTEAEKAARRAVELCRDDATCFNLLGNVLVRTGREKAAVKHFRRVTQIEPDKGWGWYNLGTALIRLGKLQEADNAFRRVEEVDPELYDQILSLNRNKLMTGQGPDQVSVRDGG